VIKIATNSIQVKASTLPSNFWLTRPLRKSDSFALPGQFPARSLKTRCLARSLGRRCRGHRLAIWASEAWRLQVTYGVETADSSGKFNEAIASGSLRGVRSKKNARSACSRMDRGRELAEIRQERLRRDALEEMFAASRSRFLAMANSILRNREDAEDAVQDAFVSAYRNVRNFEGRSALRTWLTRIVLNSALMTRRKRKTMPAKPITETDALFDDEWLKNLPDGHPNPEMVHAERETLEFVDGVLGKLKPALRQAFTMTYHDELSGMEASAKLGISTVTFKARLFRAKQQVSDRTKRVLAGPVHKKPLRHLNA
jgi:RNA polymerase sigma-70 factor, ECF subfamily